MGNSLAPKGDYTELSQLASRIATHLTKNPRDAQARDDLRYVVAQLRGGATAAANTADITAASGPSTEHPGFAIAAGLGQAAADLPRGILQTILHPIQTAGQVTGIGNIPAAVTVMQDPSASLPERLDALARATPLNLGYATERNLLNATGAKSDEPASLVDQARAAGNVASLALLGAKPGPVLRVVRGGLRSVVGPLLDRTVGRAPPAEAPAPVTAIAPKTAAALQARIARPIGGPFDDLAAAEADLKAGKITPEEYQTAVQAADRALRDQPTGLLTAEAPPAAPVEQLGKGQLLPYYPRGGMAEQTLPPPSIQSAPVIGPASPEVMARAASHADLMRALGNPQTVSRVRAAILAELQRRGIVGPGLLSPALP